MSLYDNAKNWLENKVLSHVSLPKLMVATAIRKGDEKASSKIELTATSIVAQNLAKYKAAVAAATDPENPEWSGLVDFYYNMMLDNHLRSLIESRILYAQRSPTKMVDEKGNEDEAASKLLDRPWFFELIYLVLFSQFGGRKLLELYDLTPEGELDYITEIPQTHFNTKLGIITRNPGENTGWNYRDPIFANYYVQVGRDMDLGMFEMMGPILLSKKLGMGAMLDYIDKFGVPPIFITTDREDDGRIKELVAAAKAFKSNSFMVGRGQEKFEIGQAGGQGVAPFETAMKICNDEISKGVIGGTGVTDDKSFVGSAEIQFKLAKDRFESDKTFFKHFFNQHIKPRLVQLSPVYKSFEKLNLEWDNSETMSKKDLIDTIVKIGQVWEIDPEYVQQTTGIPILALRQNTGIQPAGGKDEKK